MSEVNGRDVSSSGLPSPPFPFPGGIPEGVARARPVVLLVDDIEDCRDVYGQYLRHSGYEVVEAVDGHEALAKVATFRPDVIVMDLWMPRLDGWESIRRLKGTPATAGIPVLVLTGDAYTQARTEALAAGCDAYLVKPCLPTEVATEVNRLMDRHKPQAASGPVAGDHRPVKKTGTGASVLAGVVADLDQKQKEMARQIHSLLGELAHLRDRAQRAVLERQLREVESLRESLAAQIEALKVIARTADVKITIPARRGSRKS